MCRLTKARAITTIVAVLVCAAVIGTGCAVPDSWGRAPGRAAAMDTGAPQYTVDQAISDKAQLNTIAFDAIGFLTGTLGSDSFFPPGKVADWWGFQYLRDNDPSEMGHNTDFLTRAALNMYTVLDTEQRAALKALATRQVDDINEYGYRRFVLMKAFRRQLEGDLPTGATGLSEQAVRAYSAELYRLDGAISYERASVMGPILAGLDSEQRAYLDSMVGTGMTTWPNVAEPEDMRDLSHDEKVAVMTYAGDLFSWYAGDVEADVYFCPERHGTYFGSFYLKDAPAVGNPGYSIPTTMTGQMGESFLALLTEAQRAEVTSIIPEQKPDLLEIVTTRRAVAQQLRAFREGSAPSTTTVGELMSTYGELDGELAYRYVTAFAKVDSTLTDEQRATLGEYRRQMIGDLAPSGAFLYSQEIAMPQIPDTDFLFDIPTTSDPVTSFWAKPQSGAALLGWANPSSFEGVRVLRSTSGFATTATVTASQTEAYAGTGTSARITGLSNGTTYYFTVFALDSDGRWSSGATASATPRATTYLGLRRSSTGARKGAPVTLTAVVSPQGAAPGRTVRLQRKSGDTWRTVAAVKLTTNRARFVRRDRVTAYYRVLVSQSTKYAAATSATVRIRRW